MKKQGLLGVHMIIKNEEDVLPRCLNSIKDFADELVIIDTGSTDRSIEIAQGYGARIIKAGWSDDFAAARNLGLQLAETEWILYLDADEILVEGIRETLLLLNGNEANGFWISIENILGSKKEDRVSHSSVRLFRNDPRFRFEGEIHEQIVPSIMKVHPLSSIQHCPLKLLHFGYLPEFLQKKQKLVRNLKILENVLRDEPHDPFNTYNLGVTYSQQGQWQQAKETLKTALERAPMDAAYRPTLIRDYVKILIELNQTEAAYRLLNKEVEQYPDYADLHCIHGHCLHKQGLLMEAYESYKRAVQAHKPNHSYVTETGMNSFRAYTAMGDISKIWNDYPHAEEHYRQSLKIHRHYIPALTGWADLMNRLGRSDEWMKEQLIMLIQPHNAEELMLAARILLQIGAYSEALTILVPLEISSLEGKRLLSEGLMHTGQFMQAYPLLLELMKQEGHIGKASLLHNQALCCWSENQRLPLSFYESCSKDEQKSYEDLEQWVMEEPVDRKDSSTIQGQLACQLIDRSLELKLIRVGKRLSLLSDSCLQRFSKSLYVNGFIYPAADRLLKLMESGLLDADCRFFLAEILYDKGHYGQAAAFAEQTLDLDSDFERARIITSLSYLHIARGTIIRQLESRKDHILLKNDLAKIEKSILMLKGVNWHTLWNGAQRRNHNAAEADFFMHDCER